MRLSIEAIILTVSMLLSAGCSATVDTEANSRRISVAQLKSLYRGVPLRIAADVWFDAVVVSNDLYRNFSNTLVVEDSTGGVALAVEGDELYMRYRVGDTLRVECNALTLGSRGGEIWLGDAPQGTSELSTIDAAVAALHLSVRGHAPFEPQPHRLKIAELSPRYAACYVQILDVGFVEQGQSWYSAEAEERHLIDTAADTLAVRTRSDALFAAVMLPSGRGSIRGILSYFAGRYSLKVNNEFDNDLE